MFLTEKKLSVVVPCYNEESNIPELYTRLSKIFQEITSQYEFIFVDNNSRDRTRAILRDLAARDTHVKAIFFARNFGTSQYGFSAGTAYAKGDAVVWMEADLQDPPEVICEFVKKWQEGFDVVYGIRLQKGGPFFSRFMRRLFYRIFGAVSYLDIPPDAGDFSLLDRRVVDVFNAMPERSRFVRGMRAWLGFRHAGVKYTRNERIHGVTSNPSFRKNVWWAKKFIFSFSYAPFEFITCGAFWIAIFFPFAFCILLFLGWAGTISWFSVFVVLTGLALLVFQSVALAFLGEAIATILEETKQRPPYVIEEKINLSELAL